MRKTPKGITNKTWFVSFLTKIGEENTKILDYSNWEKSRRKQLKRKLFQQKWLAFFFQRSLTSLKSDDQKKEFSTSQKILTNSKKIHHFKFWDEIR